jgi:hypothetical protein
MIINRSHIPWLLMVAIVTVLLSVMYIEVFRPGSIPNYLPAPASLGQRPFGHRSVGATPLGIVYGAAAFLIFIFAALLGGRKKVRHWRIGRAETWMRAHIWLTVLTIPLVLLHCGFHSGSIMTTGLLVLYGIVMLSGFYGLALQQVIPKQMMERLSREVIYDQIPYLRKMLAESATRLREELAAAQPPDATAPRIPSFAGGAAAALAVARPDIVETRVTLVEVLDRDVLPYLRSRAASRSKLRHRQISENIFRMLRLSVVEEYRTRVDEMRVWCDDRRQMDLQETMQHWLHYWLFVHVPLSMLLLLWTAWHAFTGLYYY